MTASSLCLFRFLKRGSNGLQAVEHIERPCRDSFFFDVTVVVASRKTDGKEIHGAVALSAVAVSRL